MLNYCVKCVMPSSKPDLFFDKNGICSACNNFSNRKKINWDNRKKELSEILNNYKDKNSTNWDCIVPVSGGKDSTYQVLKMIELGLNYRNEIENSIIMDNNGMI